MVLTPSDSLVEKEAQEAILNDLLPNLSDSKKDALFYTMWIMVEKREKAIIGGFCFHGEPDENRQVEIGYGTDDKNNVLSIRVLEKCGFQRILNKEEMVVMKLDLNY